MNTPLKIAFLDRDGTLIFEPPDTKQIDTPEKVRILPGVIEGLTRLKNAGYQFALVSNQDGLGTRAFPAKKFEAAQKKFLALLCAEKIDFYKIFICPHTQSEKCPCRKPKTGLVDMFFKKTPIDRQASFVIGDRETDRQFAENNGITGFSMVTNGSFPRLGTVQRKTAETNISVLLNIDGTGKFNIDTGLNFFNHMLEQFSKHSLIDLSLTARGDLHIDEHHTVEDTALALGAALNQALGARTGIKRYGFLLPMDDALVEVALDLGGRPYSVFNASFRRERVGDLPTELLEHFFKSLSDALRANIHITVRAGRNEHHKIEAMFKALAKALRMACENDPRTKNILPTTKGIL